MRTAAEYAVKIAYNGMNDPESDEDDLACWRMIGVVANELLNFVRGDDDEPVTEQWLQSIGFRRIGQRHISWAREDIRLLPDDWRTNVFGKFIQLPTRADVRRFCTAVNVELLEA